MPLKPFTQPTRFPNHRGREFFTESPAGQQAGTLFQYSPFDFLFHE